MQFDKAGSANGPGHNTTRRLAIETLEPRAVPASLIDLVQVVPGPSHVTQIREGGTPYTGGTGYTIQLSATPTAPVTITLAADDSRMLYERYVDGTWKTADTFVLSPTDTSEYLDILAAEDTEVNGTVTASVDVIVSSEDPRFNGVLAAPISLTVLDNDFLVTNTADSGTGSLRQAVSDIERGWGTIRFAENLSGQTIKLQSQIKSAGDVSIDASGLRNGLTITPSVPGARHRFFESTDSLRLTNLTVKGFHSDGFGGAILMNGYRVNVYDTVFEDNSAISGGAVAIQDGFGTFFNTRFGGDSPDTGNRASERGGAVFVAQAAGWIGVEGSTLINNTSADDGGAIWSAGHLRVRQTEFVGNGAGGTGGAIASSGEFRLSESTLSANRGNAGGGLYFAGGNALVLNSTLSANVSQTDGGGVLVAGGQVAIVASTLTGNHATLLGGGISTSASNAATLNNSIVAGNTIGPAEGQSPGDLAGLAPKSSYSLVADPGSALGLPHGQNGNIVGQSNAQGDRQILPVEEILLPLADNGGSTRTHALRRGSVAINQGLLSAIPLEPVSLPSNDQRGADYARVIGAAMDMGAIEFQRWRNLESPTDVNDDGHITAQDALNIINELHLRRFSDSSGSLSPLSVNGETQYYYDVNGDGYVTALDALLVINQLHRPAERPEAEASSSSSASFDPAEGESLSAEELSMSQADRPQCEIDPSAGPSRDAFAAAQWFSSYASREAKKSAQWPNDPK